MGPDQLQVETHFGGVENSGRPIIFILRTIFGRKILFFIKILIEWFGLKILSKKEILIELEPIAPARRCVDCALPPIAPGGRTYVAKKLFVKMNYFINFLDYYWPR